VHHAHQNSILHRDLKPENILLDSAGQPHVTDFGLAKRIEGDSALTYSGHIAGTPEYMSPEQAEASGRLTTAADVYGLGAILYAVLTGRAPFKDENVLKTLRQVAECEPTPPSSINPKVPRDLEIICLKCLEKQPAKRYTSAAELADRLQLFVEDKPIPDRKVGHVERAWRWSRRNPLVAALIAGILLASALGVNGVAFYGFKANKNAKIAEEQRDHAQLQRYVAVLQLAQLTKSNDRALELLDRLVPAEGEVDLRGLEWNLLRRLNNRKLFDIQFKLNIGPQGIAGGLGRTPFALGLLPCFATGGRWLATTDGSNCGPVTVRELESSSSSTPHEILLGPQVLSISFNAAADRVAIVGDDSAGGVWDPATGEEVFRLNLERGNGIPIHCAAFTHDGNRLCTGHGDGTVKVWDANEGALIDSFQTHEAAVAAVAFSPEGDLLASGSGNSHPGFSRMDQRADATLCIREMRTGKTFTLFRSDQDKAVTSVAFSPDGKWLAVGSMDSFIRIWGVEQTGDGPSFVRPIHLAHMDGVTGAVFSPDSRWLASGSLDRFVRIWDMRSGGTESLVLPCDARAVRRVAFSDDGSRLFSLPSAIFFTGRMTEQFPVRVWDVTPRPRRVSAHDHGVRALALSEDGTLVASGGQDKKVRLWRLNAADVQLDPFWTLAAEALDCEVLSVDFSADSKRLAIGGRDSEGGHPVRVWNLETRRCFTLDPPHGGPVTAVKFSPDGKWLASASDDGSVRLWHATTGDLRLDLRRHSRSVPCLAFSPDGRRLASGSRDQTVIIWDPDTGQIEDQLEDHDGEITAVAFSPDGKSLAAAVECAQNLVKVWDVATRRVQQTFKGHMGAVNSIVFTQEGRRLLSSSRDRSIKIWAPGGEELLSLSGHENGIDALVVDPRGHWLVSGDRSGAILLWDARPEEKQTE
jgi:WD40 repeat protein